jgi:hypothetical protein
MVSGTRTVTWETGKVIVEDFRGRIDALLVAEGHG